MNSNALFRNCINWTEVGNEVHINWNVGQNGEIESTNFLALHCLDNRIWECCLEKNMFKHEKHNFWYSMYFRDMRWDVGPLNKRIEFSLCSIAFTFLHFQSIHTHIQIIYFFRVIYLSHYYYVRSPIY